MEIDKIKGQIVVGAIVGLAGWFGAETHSQAQRISALEMEIKEHHDTDLYLRTELQQLRLLYKKVK